MRLKRVLRSVLVVFALALVLTASTMAADETAQYGTWDVATIAPEGQAVSFTLDTYNGTITDNQIWIAVNVEEDDQAIQMDYAGVSDSMRAYLFRESDLQTGSFTWNSALNNWGFSSGATYQWKADYAGVYYLLLRPNSSSDVVDKAATLTCTLVNGDLNEFNDTWQTATELTENVNTYYNLAGQNDVDWFKITTAVPGEAIKLQFSNFDYTVANISARLYTEETVQAGNANSNNSVWYWTNFSTNGSSNYKANVPGAYYLKVEAYDSTDYVVKDLKLSYTTVQPDANELNDSWDTATKLAYAYAQDFTLNGINDQDWFCFETSQPNEVVYLYLNGFETDYSNHVGYYIYDATEDGYNTSAIAHRYNITSTYSAVYTFANVGRHYIKIYRYEDAAIENTLSLRIEQGTTDAQEPNDTWLMATPLAENVAQSYNLPSSTDKDWFHFSTTEPNQILELTSVLPQGAGVYVYLYSGADFQESGDSAGAMTYWSLSTGTQTCRRMLSDAGDYYLKIYNRNDSFEEYATIAYSLQDSDDNERNNTWKTATAMNAGVTVEYDLSAGNDVDWFKLTATKPNQTLDLTSYLPQNAGVYLYLYSGADFEVSGDSAGSKAYWSLSNGTSTHRYMLGDAGDYYVRITERNGWFDETATLTYTLIDPEPSERNNTWKTATTLNAGVATSYNLFAGNDTDYFKFTSTKDNQTVELASYLPDGEGVYVYLYSGADYLESGDGAGYKSYWALSSGAQTRRYMLGDAGDYYVRITERNGWFDEAGTITYSLIDPDGNERNNGYTTATELAAGAAVYYTLPAYNDYDYFHIGAMTAGDILQTTFGNMSAQERAYANLYVLKEGDTDLTYVGYIYVPKNGTTRHDWNINTDGEYYLRMNCDEAIDQTMWLRYAVTATDKPVTGISSITNGGSTIFEGKTLQLYANVTPSNATNQAVTWTSSNTAVATIDENGLVTGVKPGSTTITATTVDGGYTMSVKISVVEAVPVESVSVTAGDVAQKGETEKNPYYLALGTGIDLTASVVPDTATERAVTWSVSDESVLAVNIYGQVFAVGSGDAYVTATTVDRGYTANFYVNVPDETYPVRSIALNCYAATLYMGEDGMDLVATVTPSYATNPAVKWSSDNEAVATVDANGHVTVVGEGYAAITVCAAENNAVINTCVISVQPERVRVTGIKFEQAEINVGIYGTVTLVPVISPLDATDQSVTWTTSNKTVATVSRTGEVTALNIGTAVITATTNDGQFTAEITIRVTSTAAVGDLNNDGDVDAADALLILRCSVGLVKLSAAQELVADVNGDGFIDAGDAILILRYDAGLIDAFPVEEE